MLEGFGAIAEVFWAEAVGKVSIVGDGTVANGGEDGAVEGLDIIEVFEAVANGTCAEVSVELETIDDGLGADEPGAEFAAGPDTVGGVDDVVDGI